MEPVNKVGAFTVFQREEMHSLMVWDQNKVVTFTVFKCGEMYSLMAWYQ